MNATERVYGVLIVSSSDKLNRALYELLPPSKYEPVCTVGNISAAKRKLSERDFDFILINSPLPDGDETGFSIEACDGNNSVVMLMARAERVEEAFERSSAHGVFLLPKPLSRQSFSTALNWLTSARERLRLTEKKVTSFESKMEEIRLVNRAKWKLIQQLGMAEPEAHRYIEKQAMDRCVPRRTVAEEIIKTYG